MSQSLTSTQNKGRNAVEGEDDTLSNATTTLSGLLQRWKKVLGVPSSLQVRSTAANSPHARTLFRPGHQWMFQQDNGPSPHPE